jgi:hypothetical protein
MDAEQRSGVMIPKVQTAVLNTSQKTRYDSMRDTAESSTHVIYVKRKPAKFCQTPIDLA